MSTQPTDQNCIQSTADLQLNKNFVDYTKILIDALKNGLIPVKNANRIQNLTVDDIVDIVKNKLPNQNINNYITDNSANIIEMIDSYEIIRDTKFVTTDYLPFRVITRREQDITDPTGETYLNVPHLKVKLPIDLINKDRIVQVYITNKNDQTQASIQTDNIFDYFIDIDPTDPNGCYIIEARAKLFDIQNTYIIDEYTNPLEPNSWGTWVSDRFIKVTYLVDSNWYSNTNPVVIPDPNVRVAKTTSVKVTPMNFGLSDITEPNESVMMIPSAKNNLALQLDQENSNPLTIDTTNIISTIIKDPKWLIIGNSPISGIDHIEFISHLKWLSEANKLISQNIDPDLKNIIVNWRPVPNSDQLNTFILYPSNKIISQLTYNLGVESFINWGTKVGLASNIIEFISSNTIVCEAISELIAYDEISPGDDNVDLFVKFDRGSQYPFIVCKVVQIPSRIIEYTYSNKTELLRYAQTNFIPTRIIEELTHYVNDRVVNNINGIYSSSLYMPVRIINFLSSLTTLMKNYTKPLQDPSRIIEFLNTSSRPGNNTIKPLQDPSRIIEELEQSKIYKNIWRGSSKNRYKPSRLIEPLWSNKLSPSNVSNRIKDKVRIILETDTLTKKKLPKVENLNLLFEPARYILFIRENIAAAKTMANKLISPNRIIEQEIEAMENIEFEGINFVGSVNYLSFPARFIEQVGNIVIESINEDDNNLDIFNRVLIHRPSWIINQEVIFPIHMQATSGSIEYLTDNYNAHVISSLAREEFIPLITAEGKMFRTEQEFFANQDQTVFNIKHNPDLLTIYRQGFKLSKGDYYTNGYNIILKSPANAGEIINVISDRRYVFSESVSKEDLFNAINQLKTDKPIITFPSFGYEKSTVEVKINNYDPTVSYIISLKFEGLYTEDIAWHKKGDTYFIELPEVITAAKRTLTLNIWANLTGRLQSSPTEANITIKNLFDFNTDNVLDVSRIVFGITPSEWSGLSNRVYTFNGQKSPKTIYEPIYADPASGLNNRISLSKNNWYQTTPIDTRILNASNLETVIGVENLGPAKFEVVSSNGEQTIFKVAMSTISIGEPSLMHDEIIEIFNKGKLYCIPDDSTYTTMYNQIINTGYKTYKYNYIPLNEFTPNLNILPIDTNTWLLEHTNNLKNRIIHSLLYKDLDFLVDFDYENFANISEEQQVTTRNLKMENMEYKLVEGIPLLDIKLSDPKITTLVNPYIGIGSRINLMMDHSNLMDIQSANPQNLIVNNIYSDKVFDGKLTDIDSGGLTTLNTILDTTKYLKHSKITSNDGIFNTNRLNDQLFLSDEGITGDHKLRIVLNRFYNENSRISDIPKYINKTKLLYTLDSLDDSSFKSLVYAQQKTNPSNTGFKSNYALMTFGGTETYKMTDSNNTDIIESKLSFQRIYIEDQSNLSEVTNSEGVQPFTDGILPVDQDTITDGYKCIEGEYIHKRIPNWWDVVTRPSVREARQQSLADVWVLIKNGIDTSSEDWLKITSGIIRKPTVNILRQEEYAGAIAKTSDTICIPDRSQVLLVGGEGYVPTVRLMEDATVTEGYINMSPNLYWKEALISAYSLKSTSWKNRISILAIDYGWENNEPYVEYAWAKWYQFVTYESINSVQTAVYHDGLKFYIHRVSRKIQANTNIYHLDLTRIEDYNPGDNDIYPNFITKISSPQFKELFNPGEILPIEYKSGYPAGNNKAINFIDSIYDSGSFWFIIKPANSLETKLFNINPINYGVSNDSSYLTYLTDSVGTVKFQLEEFTNLSSSIGNGSGKKTYWKFVPNIIGVLLDSGPLIVKYKTSETENGCGIYQYDYWNKILHSKLITNIVPSTNLIGIPEYSGIRNPYIIELDTDIKKVMNLVGINFNLTIYLDKFMALLTKRQFLQFKEEIFNINSGASTMNSLKELMVLENIIPLGIKAMIPTNDDYRDNSVQVILNRISTQTGGIAENLVFRLSNKSKYNLEVDSIRFKLY